MAEATLTPVPHRLLRAAQEVLDLLASHGHSACAIGGLAVLRWGEPRVTQDVDISVLAPWGEEAPVVDLLVEHLPVRRPDARAFALANRVLLVTSADGVPIDVGLAALPFEREALSRAREWRWTPELAFPVCTAEDLLIYKLAAGRPRDLLDVDGIVRLQWRNLDIERVRSRTRELAAMLEGPDLLEPFEHALLAARREIRE